KTGVSGIWQYRSHLPEPSRADCVLPPPGRRANIGVLEPGKDPAFFREAARAFVALGSHTAPRPPRPMTPVSARRQPCTDPFSRLLAGEPGTSILHKLDVARAGTIL